MAPYQAPPGGFKSLTTLGAEYTKELYLAHPTTKDLAVELDGLIPVWAKKAEDRAVALAKQVKGLKLEVQELKEVAEKARKDLEAANRMLHALLIGGTLKSDPSKWGEEHLAADPPKPSQLNGDPGKPGGDPKKGGHGKSDDQKKGGDPGKQDPKK
jgi:hypothetical protein